MTPYYQDDLVTIVSDLRNAAQQALDLLTMNAKEYRDKYGNEASRRDGDLIDALTAALASSTVTEPATGYVRGMTVGTGGNDITPEPRLIFDLQTVVGTTPAPQAKEPDR